MGAKISCPHCEYRFTKQRSTGKERCPSCGERFAPPAARGARPSREDQDEEPGRNLPWKTMAVTGLIVLAAVFAKDIERLLQGWLSKPEPVAKLPEPLPAPTAQPEPEPQPVPDTPRQRQERINTAVDRGVAFLKDDLRRLLDDKIGEQNPVEQRLGRVAFAALTLVKSDVSIDDDLIQSALKKLRDSAATMNKTYTVACTILMLDRAGTAQDRDLILQLGTRLLLGQTSSGAWGYDLTLAESTLNQQQLEQLLFNYLRTVSPQARLGDRRLLAPALAAVPIVRWLVGAPPPSKEPRWDNSNTQFAVLALWVAQRHGLPVLPSLTLVNLHFRNTQKNGAWGYGPHAQYRASMTCAGLICVGICNILDPFAPGEAKLDAPNRQRDPALERGFLFLADVVRELAAPGRDLGDKIINADAGSDLYYLWSLERVAVLYGIDMIGGQDWYAASSAIIVKAQKADGSWQEAYGAIPDTCFALLVLKKVNLAPDVKLSPELTKSIKNALMP